MYSIDGPSHGDIKILLHHQRHDNVSDEEKESGKYFANLQQILTAIIGL